MIITYFCYCGTGKWGYAIAITNQIAVTVSMASDRKEPPILSLSAFDQSYNPKLLGRGSYGLVETVKYRGSICAIKHIHGMLLKGPGREKVIDDFLQESDAAI